MDTIKRNINLIVSIFGFAGTFIAVGVGWADIKNNNQRVAVVEQQVTDIRINGTELSRRERQDQVTIHADERRRLEQLEKAVSEYANVRIEVASTKMEVLEVKDRLSSIMEMLKRVNITSKP